MNAHSPDLKIKSTVMVHYIDIEKNYTNYAPNSPVASGGTLINAHDVH